MKIAVTKMSSKGQIVIPAEMRKDIKQGEELVVMKNKRQIIIEKMENISKTLKEDLEFARQTEEAWKRHDKGEFIEMEFDDFIKEMEKW